MRRLFGIKEFALAVLLPLGYVGSRGSPLAWVAFVSFAILFVAATRRDAR